MLWASWRSILLSPLYSWNLCWCTVQSHYHICRPIANLRLFTKPMKCFYTKCCFLDWHLDILILLSGYRKYFFLLQHLPNFFFVYNLFGYLLYVICFTFVWPQFPVLWMGYGLSNVCHYGDLLKRGKILKWWFRKVEI